MAECTFELPKPVRAISHRYHRMVYAGGSSRALARGMEVNRMADEIENDNSLMPRDPEADLLDEVANEIVNRLQYLYGNQVLVTYDSSVMEQHGINDPAAIIIGLQIRETPIGISLNVTP